MKKILVLLSLLLTLSAGAYSQPVATGAVNAASYANPELPNGGLPQGGMFVVFGEGMGGTTPQVLTFPLTTELDGVSIQVTVGGTTVDCIMIYALSTQSACILPSSTPIGAGTLTVTVNGQVSAPLDIEVVEHSFGIFTINNAGSGPGVITDNPSFVPNTLVHAAHQGEAWTIWGTGLGAIDGDETVPQPGDLADLDVTVLVGTVEAQVLYRGRSGDVAGIDQINFIVPGGVTGCYVPVAVLVEGVTSNFASISIADGGDVCSEQSGLLTSTNLDDAFDNGSLRVGSVTLSRATSVFTNPFPAQTIETATEIATGAFWEFTLDQLLRTQSIVKISTIGACNVVQIQGSGGEFADPIAPTVLDAGAALALTGPAGSQQIERIEFGYHALLNNPFPGLPLSRAGAGPVDQVSSFLVPGDYTITGLGGGDVGPFAVNLTIPPPLVWTNRDSITRVVRSQGQLITWTGGYSDGYVQITGSSTTFDRVENLVGAYFFCRASAQAGSFTIPPAVLLALPVSTIIEHVAFGTLSVGNATDGISFQADGLDFGYAAFNDYIGIAPNYE